MTTGQAAAQFYDVYDVRSDRAGQYIGAVLCNALEEPFIVLGRVIDDLDDFKLPPDEQMRRERWLIRDIPLDLRSGKVHFTGYEAAPRVEVTA